MSTSKNTDKHADSPAVQAVRVKIALANAQAAAERLAKGSKK